MVSQHNARWLNLLAANQSKSCQANRHSEGLLGQSRRMKALAGWWLSVCSMLPTVS